MAEQERHEAQPTDPFGPDIPVMQRILDSPPAALPRDRDPHGPLSDLGNHGDRDDPHREM